ncbi:L,D-transpeptidase family protein [Shimia sp. SDUM112013]|uniref:L,D-transpeptidase family protein n=1 Tax=Shimia sp. SDUM112013 TaxID=3136160 RepID=UPI0032EEA02A
MSPADMVLTPTGLRFMGRIFPCTIGRGGIRSDKQEGDGATPRGSHQIVGLLFRPDRMPRPAPWAIPIRNGDLWSDAADDTAYNQWVRAPYPHSHERLRRADPLYDLVLLTNWNWPDSRPGAGSAIFLHQYRRQGFPTEGCIAFRRDHLLWIASRAVPGTRVIVP